MRVPSPPGEPTIDPEQRSEAMTILWFVVWAISNAVGDREALTLDPVNWWVGLLLLAVALDINRPQVIGRRGK
jgi:hypothetical protein